MTDVITDFLATLEDGLQQILRLRRLTSIAIILFHRNFRTLAAINNLTMEEEQLLTIRAMLL